ncbi:MAG: orotidine-5'-phosphate decarboxylase [Rhizobiales bacterium]|nr:orotidine-5'-phosphate decarboxylase [Hyphomicrobiales bacterium]NRB14432.1 orotidine-5'-phosphate decarboxylase [Hyphomicrobiales bacterium]
MSSNNPYNPTLVALDTPDLKQALKLAKNLASKVGGMKLGMEFFNANGPQAVRQITALGMPVFIDLKLSDIPNTVAAGITSLLPLEPFMLNIHILGGRAMMEAAVDAVNQAENLGYNRPLLIGVTIVTSMQDSDMQELGLVRNASDQVVHLAKLAQDCGLDGVVCSSHEIAAIKQVCGDEFKTIVPGIRPKGVSAHDQKRVMTPSEAIAQGADYLVIGRAITQASNPEAMADDIWRSVRHADL